MVARRRGATRGRRWTDSDQLQLETGCNFLQESEPLLDNLDLAREAWSDLKTKIMFFWFEDLQFHAGRRPWAWWLFEQGRDDMPRRKDIDNEAELLRQLGELTDREEEILNEQQRKQIAC